MALNILFELIIHPVFKPYHLSATHSNISFGIALRNIANKRSSFHEQSVFDINPSLSKEQTHVVQPISVASHFGSSKATINPQPTHEHSTAPDFMMTSYSDVEDEHAVQTNLSLNSTSPFVLESVHDQPFIAPNQSVVIEVSSTNIPSSSSQIIPQPQTTNVSPPPTFLLDSVIIKEVCENIFVDLEKLVKSRNNFVRAENYEEKWTALRERVDTIMCELQKLSVEAHHQSTNTLNNWFKEVVNNMKEVEANRNQARSKQYISDSPFYLDASSIITASDHEDLCLNWLTKLKAHTDAPILAKLKCDSEQEQKIKKLEKELFEQKLMYEELKRNMAIQREEFLAREDAQVRGYNELKEAMQKQLENMTNMMKEMM